MTHSRRAPAAVGVMLVMLLVGAGVRADDWPTYQHDFRRSAATAEKLDVKALRARWVWRSDSPPQPAWFGPAKWDAYAGIRGLRSMRNYDPVFHAISVGQNVYFGSTADDSVYCLDAVTGRRRWRFTTGGPVRVAPTYSDGKLYFGSDDGQAYCLNAASGELVWSYRPVPAGRMILNNGRFIPFWPCRTGVIVENGTAQFGFSMLPWKESYLCAVDAITGKAEGEGRFVKKLNGLTMEGPMAASPHQLVAPQGRVAPKLFARADGRSLGALSGGGGSFVILTSDDRILHGPGNKTGWITGSNSKTRARIASYPSGNAMIVVGETSYLLTDTELRASNWVKRKHLWKSPATYPYAIILAGDVLLAGGEDEVAAISTADGKLLWKHAIDGKAYGLAVAGGRLLVSTDEGAVYCFAAGAAASDPQGVASKRLSAPPVENVQLAVGPWLQFTDPQTAVVRWQTAKPSPTILDFHGAGPAQRIEDARPKTRHEATIKGLRRNRVGSYTVTRVVDGKASITAPLEVDTFFNYNAPTAPRRLDVYPDDAAAKQIAKAADYALSKAKTTGGICLVLGSENGQLAYEIARRSRLRVIGFETDRAKVDASRETLHETGLYGARVTIHHVESLDKLPVAGQCANLIVSQRMLSGDERLGAATEVLRLLRPGAGIAVLGQPERAAEAEALAKLKAWLGPLAAKAKTSNDASGLWALLDRPPLVGAGAWTHLYGAADNSGFGGEALAGATTVGDLEVQWLGRPGPRYQVDRNGRKPSPLSTGGRLFMQGNHRIVALDAFNGVVLWSLELPDFHRFNMPRDCSNWCADEQHVYAAVRDKLWRIDAQSGHVTRMFDVLPADNREWKYDWGYLASRGDKIIGSAVKQGTAFGSFWGKAGDGWYDAQSGPVTHKVCSDNMFALDKRTGKVTWNYKGGVIINSTITAGSGRIYLVESRSDKVRDADTRRVGLAELWHEQFLVALDENTGEKLWERSIDIPDAPLVFYLAHAEKKLVLVTSAAKKYRIDTFADADGTPGWKTEFGWPGGKGDHGTHMSRPTMVGNTLYVRPSVFDLHSGKLLAARMPGGGCGTYCATTNALFFRAGTINMWNRKGGKPTTWPRLRPDCWLSTIPAGGMLLAPEGGGGCSCGNWMETSIGFIPIALDGGRGAAK